MSALSEAVEKAETTDALTGLLIGMTKLEVQQLRASVHSEEEFADRVSVVLGEAFELAGSDPRLNASLGTLTQRSVLDIARRQPDTLGDAIAPAMGPAIRGMVALSLADLNERVESVIQQSFSMQGLKWRFESFRTGTPLAELVLRDTLTYRVEHALLIHRSSGTLLNHAMQPEYKGKDPAVVAAMLTAVKSFLEDTFDRGQDTPADSDSQAVANLGELSHQFSAGDTSILVKASGELALAVVVRGTQSARLEQLLSKELEGLHSVYGGEAQSFDGNLDRFVGALPMLEDCLYTEQAKPKNREGGSQSERFQKYRKYVPAAVAVVILSAAWAYDSAVQSDRWQSFVQTLNDQPGVAITDAVRLNRNSAEVRGLRDPDAAKLAECAEQFGFTDVAWELQNILSLEPSVTLARAHRILLPPATVNLRFGEGVLRVTGRARAEWVDTVRNLHIPGVTRIDLSHVLPPEAI